jgi:trans-aconitate 2-methyltransferase
MSDWNAEHYLKFGDERTRAVADLVARIRLAAPSRIVDLGCGPGNSTAILRQRWPDSDIVGIDNSPKMIAAAREKYPDQEWQAVDISEWRPESPVDLVFSNAALQWVPNHAGLMTNLTTATNADGALAFQVPSGSFAEVRKLIHELSHEARWNHRMQAARAALTMETPSFYYDAVAQSASSVDIWESEYHHVLDSTDAIVDWISSTGLRPFVAALADESERADFVAELRRRVAETYELRIDGRVLFPFRRTFVIAYR